LESTYIQLYSLVTVLLRLPAAIGCGCCCCDWLLLHLRLLL